MRKITRFLFFKWMDKEFVLPPRRRFTVKEKRRNAEIEWTKENWRWDVVGLWVVHELKQHDPELRWLAELFPLEEEKVFDDVAVQRLGAWCAAHPEDARALRYLAQVKSSVALMEKAAAMGDARAMAECVSSSESSESFEKVFQLARLSSEKGDASGTYCLMACFRDGLGCERIESMAEELLDLAADLGNSNAFHDLLEVEGMEPAKRLKLLVIFFDIYFFGLGKVCSALEAVLGSYSTDGSYTNAMAIFEVGEVFKGCIDIEKERLFGKKQELVHLECLLRPVVMYDRWCDAARDACVTWILFAKSMGFNKDVRKMIARLVWDARREARVISGEPE